MKFNGYYAGFHSAKFAGCAIFEGAEFAADEEGYGGAEFTEATFIGKAYFRDAKFGSAGFYKANFAEHVTFNGAKFLGDAEFSGATFAVGVGFGAAKFAKDAEFNFDGARLPSIYHQSRLLWGWTTRAARPAEGENEGWLYMVRDEDSSE